MNKLNGTNKSMIPGIIRKLCKILSTEVIKIRISINDNLKVVQFWLTSAEAEDETVLERIESYSDEHTLAAKKSERYRKVIYISGDAPLWDTTATLLKYNRLQA